MKVKQGFFQELAKKRYLDYIHSLPQFKEEKTQEYLMAILVLFSILFFGIFAIMPTLSTIAELKKVLEDSTFVNEQLKTKIANMAALQQQYSLISPDLPVLLSAIPESANASLLLGQIQAVAANNNVTVTRLQVTEMPEISLKQKKEIHTFTVTVDAKGSFENIQAFYTSLVHFERILTLESMTLTKNQEDGLLQLSVKATAYYQP